jgi:hypothetical protein
MDVDRDTYSRYQVLCAGHDAWTEAEAAGSVTYFYDGMSFWRREPSGKSRVVPSWRAPGRGWRHATHCDCDLCLSRRSARVRSLSVA